MKRTLIIAEAGVNHNGSLELAKQLVDAAAEAGADIVKFQTFKSEKLVSASAPLAGYQQRATTEEYTSQLQMLRRLELSESDHYTLMAHCAKRGIRFLSTAFDMDSIKFLHSLDLKMWKIPSGEVTNYPYLKAIAQYNEPTYMSIGMCDMADVQMAVSSLLNNGLAPDNLTLLHCNTEYPTPMSDVNLAVMASLQKEFGVAIGYSDHTLGIEVPIAAVALGATVIEKHFTLNRGLDGPDHKASLEPSELHAMVQAIRNVDIAIGSPVKHVTDSECGNRAVARKSIVAAMDITKGTVLTEQNLTVKRPGTGLSPMLWETVIGTKAVRDFRTDELIVL
jgi:N,N'-diacetyllegionaminate synthase